MADDGELLYGADKANDNNYYWFKSCQYSNLTRPTHKDNIEYSIPVPGEVKSAEALSTTMSVISILGCSIIIFTYIAYKDIRTRARAMLFHLSVADLIINISLLVGLYLNFARITEGIEGHHKHGKPHIHKADLIFNSTSDPRCYLQAAVTIYGTVVSLLWSNMIGVFMVILVLKQNKSQRINCIFYIVACFVCWLFPLIIVTVDGALKKFGYVITTSMGCYIFSTPMNDRNSYRLAEIFSYDVWLFLTLILLPVLYSILFYYTHFKVKVVWVLEEDSYIISILLVSSLMILCRSCESQHKALKSWKGSPDFKLLLVPIIFVLTRIWSAVFRVLIYYANINGNDIRGCHVLIEIMLVLQGVGDNSQGTVNAVLFCFLTRAVRIRIWRSLKKLYVRVCCCGRKKHSDKYIHSPAENDSFYWPATSYEALNS